MSVFEKEEGVCLLAWAACASKKKEAHISICQVPEADYFISALSGSFINPETFKRQAVTNLADHFVGEMVIKGINLLPFSLASQAALELAQSIPVNLKPFVAEAEIRLLRRTLETDSEIIRSVKLPKTLEIA